MLSIHFLYLLPQELYLLLFAIIFIHQIFAKLMNLSIFLLFDTHKQLQKPITDKFEFLNIDL